MIYGMLASTIIAASLNSICMKKGKVSGSSIFGFNLLVAVIWLIIALATRGCGLVLNGDVVFWGVFYGITQFMFILFKTASMNAGPVSVTTLIGNASLLISVCVSVILWKETITPIDYVGLALLLVAIFLCTYKKTEEAYKPSWKYLVVAFCAFAASVGLVFKAFGKTGNIQYRDDMLVVASAVMLLLYAGSCLFVKIKNKRNDQKQNVWFYVFAVLCGLLSYFYNRSNMFLAGELDAVIFFPAFNGGVVLLSTILSLCFFKEKLAVKQILGIVFGVVAICIIGIF